MNVKEYKAKRKFKKGINKVSLIINKILNHGKES